MVHYNQSGFCAFYKPINNVLRLLVVDFVKVSLWGCKNALLRSGLEFVGNYNVITNEIINDFIMAKYKGLTFIIYKTGYTLMFGSFHKYYFDGKQNYSDFTIENLNTTIENICDQFGIDPSNATLHNIEFGLNINLPFGTNQMLDNLLAYGKHTFKNPPQRGHYRQSELKQYYIKVYDKGAQFNLGSNLMRFEIKIRKMEKLKGLGIYSLSDLQSNDWVQRICELLLDSWDNVLIYEPPINERALKPITRNKKLYQWSNPSFWNSLSKQARNRQKKQFLEYVQTSTDNRHQEIKQLIIKKFELLTNGYFLPV